jgi:hypothetical protein
MSLNLSSKIALQFKRESATVRSLLRLMMQVNQNEWFTYVEGVFAEYRPVLIEIETYADCSMAGSRRLGSQRWNSTRGPGSPLRIGAPTYS